MKVTTTVSYRNYPDARATAYAKERAIRSAKSSLLDIVTCLALGVAGTALFRIFKDLDQAAAVRIDAAALFLQILKGAGSMLILCVCPYLRIFVYPITTHRDCIYICADKKTADRCLLMYLWSLLGFFGLCIGASVIRTAVFLSILSWKTGKIAAGIVTILVAAVVLGATVLLLIWVRKRSWGIGEAVYAEVRAKKEVAKWEQEQRANAQVKKTVSHQTVTATGVRERLLRFDTLTHQQQVDAVMDMCRLPYQESAALYESLPQPQKDHVLAMMYTLQQAKLK